MRLSNPSQPGHTNGHIKRLYFLSQVMRDRNCVELLYKALGRSLKLMYMNCFSVDKLRRLIYSGRYVLFRIC